MVDQNKTVSKFFKKYLYTTLAASASAGIIYVRFKQGQYSAAAEAARQVFKQKRTLIQLIPINHIPKTEILPVVVKGVKRIVTPRLLKPTEMKRLGELFYNYFTLNSIVDMTTILGNPEKILRDVEHTELLEKGERLAKYFEKIREYKKNNDGLAFVDRTRVPTDGSELIIIIVIVMILLATKVIKSN